jgi:hypothetical protein
LGERECTCGKEFYNIDFVQSEIAARETGFRRYLILLEIK